MKVAPVRLAMYCQGTKFEWCSSSVDDDDVAGAEVVEAPGVGDEVDALGRAAREDRARALEARSRRRAHLLARALVLARSPRSESV